MTKKQIIRKRPAWLNRRLLRYAVVVLVFVAVFVAALIAGMTRLTERNKAEDACAQLLTSHIETHNASIHAVNSDELLYTELMHQKLKTIAVLASSYDDLDAMPDWKILARTVFDNQTSTTEDLWLLGSNGNVLRGERLPPELSREQITALAAGATSLDIEPYHYRSVPCAFGMLVARCDLSILDEYGVYYSTQGDETGAQQVLLITPEDMVTGWEQDYSAATPLAELCAEPEALKTAQGDVLKLGGINYYCMAGQTVDGTTVVAAIQQSDTLQGIQGETQVPGVLFMAAVLAMVIYAVIMRSTPGAGGAALGEETEIPLTRRFTLNKVMFSSLSAVALGGLALLGAASWLSLTLSDYAQHNLKAQERLTSVSTAIPYFMGENEFDADTFRWICEGEAITLANLISIQPAMAQPEYLAALSDAVGVNVLKADGESRYQVSCTDARVYDRNGNMLATGKNVLGDSMPGLDEAVLQALQENGGSLLFYNMGGEYIAFHQLTDGSERYVTLRLQGPEEFESWVGALHNAPSELDLAVNRLVSYVEQMPCDENEQVVIVRTNHLANGTTKKELITSDQTGVDTYKSEIPLLNFDNAALRSGYTGDQEVDGEHYYANVHSYLLPDIDTPDGQNYWLVYLASPADVTEGRAAMLLCVVVSGAVLLALLALILAIRTGEPVKIKGGPTPFTERATRRTRTVNGHSVNGPTMGWGTKSGWGNKTPEEKFIIALGNLALATVSILMALGIMQGAFQRQSVIHYILMGEWDRELNIFSCTYVVLVLVGTFTASLALRSLLGLITRNLGPRSETMGRLLSSLVQYAAYIGAGLYLLNFFGVNMSVLLASAGLLTLVLSPTLNMLLGDVSAGIFIVFEDEYRVGDVVTINTWRGVVLEITLRTTTLEDMMGNIKVFNNSKITELENLSVEYSVSAITVNVPYEEPIDRIENILKEELPKIAGKVDTVVGTPTYEGIDDFGDSGVLIRVHAMSREEFRFQMMRQFRHELKAMFERRGINIPYTQIVLHDFAQEAAAAEAEAAAKREKQAAQQGE